MRKRVSAGTWLSVASLACSAVSLHISSGLGTFGDGLGNLASARKVPDDLPLHTIDALPSRCGVPRALSEELTGSPGGKELARGCSWSDKKGLLNIGTFRESRIGEAHAEFGRRVALDPHDLRKVSGLGDDATISTSKARGTSKVLLRVQNVFAEIAYSDRAGNGAGASGGALKAGVAVARGLGSAALSPQIGRLGRELPRLRMRSETCKLIPRAALKKLHKNMTEAGGDWGVAGQSPLLALDLDLNLPDLATVGCEWEQGGLSRGNRRVALSIALVPGNEPETAAYVAHQIFRGMRYGIREDKEGVARRLSSFDNLKISVLRGLGDDAFGFTADKSSDEKVAGVAFRAQNAIAYVQFSDEKELLAVKGSPSSQRLLDGASTAALAVVNDLRTYQGR